MFIEVDGGEGENFTVLFDVGLEGSVLARCIWDKEVRGGRIWLFVFGGGRYAGGDV